MPAIILFLILSTAHAFSGKAPTPQPSAYPVSTPSPGRPSDPVATGVRYIAVDYYTTPAERAKIREAGALAERVRLSPCFASFMSARKLIDTNGRQPAQVTAHIQELNGAVPVEMYTRCMRFSLFSCPKPTSAVAYRNTGSTTVHLNRVAFDEATPVIEWAKTLLHEGVGHALGEYGHDFRWSPARSFSVPYSLGGADQAQGGDVMDACARGLM